MTGGTEVSRVQLHSGSGSQAYHCAEGLGSVRATNPRDHATEKGVNMETTMEELAPYMRGWRCYFGFCETPEFLIGSTLWVRLRLRAAMWRQWNSECVRGWQATPLAVGLAPDTSRRPKPCPWGFPMHTSNRSDFLHCLKKCRRNRLEPPCTDPYAWWCGRGRRVTAAPMPIIDPRTGG